MTNGWSVKKILVAAQAASPQTPVPASVTAYCDALAVALPIAGVSKGKLNHDMDQIVAASAQKGSQVDESDYNVQMDWTPTKVAHGVHPVTGQWVEERPGLIFDITDITSGFKGTVAIFFE